jgi:RNA polymerase sigma-70 factor (ECF subfamily)
MDLDAQLMLRVKEGCDTCMDLLLQRYRGPVISYIYHRVRNRAIAEELAQNVFFCVYRSRCSYQPASKFTSWLFRIANHAALNWLRDHRRESNGLSLSASPEREREWQIADGKPTADQILIRRIEQAEVRKAISELPDRQRYAVIMHKYRELEYTEIAKILGCTPQSVKSLLFRAHAALRVRLSHLAPLRHHSRSGPRKISSSLQMPYPDPQAGEQAA